MSSTGDGYEPKYGATPDEIPLTDPTRFQNLDEGRAIKLDAIEDAETELEWDLNGGEQIETPKPVHAKAVREYATYVLKMPGASPGSRRAGDADDDGEARIRVAKDYQSRYENTIRKIQDNDDDPTNDVGDYVPDFEFQTF